MKPIARHAARTALPGLVAIAALAWLVLPEAMPLSGPAAPAVAEIAPASAAVQAARSDQPAAIVPGTVAAPLVRAEPPPQPASQVGGVIAKWAELLMDPMRSGQLVRNATVEVNRKAGLDGQRRLFAAVAEKMGPGDPRRAAMLLAQVDAARGLGLREAAALLVEAVLAMDPDRAVEWHGLPRLVAFAGGPNVTPWSTSQREGELRSDLRHALWTVSGAGGWDGGTWMVWWGNWNGAEFFAWVEEVARDDRWPESAMAASIWVHAVLSRHHWVRPRHGLVPAAEFQVREAGRPLADEDWSTAFAARRVAAHAAGEAWEAELHRIEGELAPLIRQDRPDGMDVDPLAVWSLSDEFARRFSAGAFASRFPGRESARAEELRQLADDLVRISPVAVRK